MKVDEYLSEHVSVIAMKNHPHLDTDFDHLLDFIQTYAELEETIQRNKNQPKDEKWHGCVDEFLSQNQWSTKTDKAFEIMEEISGIHQT